MHMEGIRKTVARQRETPLIEGIVGAYFLVVNPAKRQYRDPGRFGEPIKCSNVLAARMRMRVDQNLAFVPAGETSRPRLAELFEHGHELRIGADRVEIGVRRDLRGTPPAAFEGESEGVQGAVGVVANQSG
jgi:hypothetical protein